ncbi:MAG: sulfatase [Isosphaeraceae bacterium]
MDENLPIRSSLIPRPAVLSRILAVGVLLACSGTGLAAAPGPHFVIFLSDDHGQKDSTPYGATDVRTPNMRALADAGCVFTQAFVASPSCAPSRAAMLTGLMPARNGAEANHTYKKDGIASLPDALRGLGYETAAFGKVAHGPDDARRHGFDHVDRNHASRAVAEYLARRDSRKPLALFVGTPEPHVPWAAVDGYDPSRVVLPDTSVDTPVTREFRARYYTDVTRADAELGEIRALARKTFGDSAVFLYTSDHGAQWPFAKWNLYDAGIQVPLIVEWPGVVKPGTTSDALVQWIDLLPTLIEIAGGTAPQSLDGRSFAKVLRGEAATHRDRVFATHSGDGNMNVTPMRCLRKEGFKYILNLYPSHEYGTHIDRGPVPDRDGVPYWDSWVQAARTDPDAAAVVKRYRERPPEELYDLAADPTERRNLAADPRHAARLVASREELERWMREQGDSRAFFGKPTTSPSQVKD